MELHVERVSNEQPTADVRLVVRLQTESHHESYLVNIDELRQALTNALSQLHQIDVSNLDD